MADIALASMYNWKRDHGRLQFTGRSRPPRNRQIVRGQIYSKTVFARIGRPIIMTMPGRDRHSLSRWSRTTITDFDILSWCDGAAFRAYQIACIVYEMEPSPLRRACHHLVTAQRVWNSKPLPRYQRRWTADNGPPLDGTSSGGCRISIQWQKKKLWSFPGFDHDSAF